MKYLYFAISMILPIIGVSQCAGLENFTVSPTMDQYPGGTQIQVCYYMSGWNGTPNGTNWLEGFEISLSPGLSNLTPTIPPENCPESLDGGNWIWVPGNITSANTGIQAGPGWFYETSLGGPVDNQPGNDWGDFGINCDWNFCFNVTVIDTCISMDLSASVTAGADGTWGSWVNNTCGLVPFNIPIGENDPIEFNSIPNSPLVDSVCVGESTSHSVLDTTGVSVFSPNNPVNVVWASAGTNEISIIEETPHGCKDTTYFTIHVLDLPDVTVQDVDSICYQDRPFQLDYSPSGGTWTPSGPMVYPQSGDSHWVIYTYQDQYGCENSDSTFVTIHPNPLELEIMGSDTFVNCIEDSRNLVYSVEHTTSSIYFWAMNGIPLDNHNSGLYIKFPNVSNTTHAITVYEINEFGCIGPESSLLVRAEKCGDVFIPNSFTPNGDNINDHFKAFCNGPIENFSLSVHDRFGVQIYKFINQQDEWFADNFPNDVYVYRFSGRVGGRPVNKTGHVTLLR